MFEQMYGNDMLVVTIVLASIGGAIVVDFIDGFVLVTVIGNVTATTRVLFEFAVVAFGATVVTLVGTTAVVVGVDMVVVAGRSYEAISRAPISCVTPGLVKL